MAEQGVNSKVEVPKSGDWPGTIEAYRLVKPHIKPQIWNLVSVIGLAIIADIVAEIVFGIIFKHSFLDIALSEVVSFVAGAFLQVAVISIYFKSLNNQDISLNEAVDSGFSKLLQMIGLMFVVDVLLIVSFVLLIVPFFIILPRIYMAPYFFIHDKGSVGEALSASWHLTKGHYLEIYGIIGLDVLIALLVLTIIGIPFAIYFWLINSGSFALLVLYLTQGKSKLGSKVTAS